MDPPPCRDHLIVVAQAGDPECQKALFELLEQGKTREQIREARRSARTLASQQPQTILRAAERLVQQLSRITPEEIANDAIWLRDLRNLLRVASDRIGEFETASSDHGQVPPADM